MLRASWSCASYIQLQASGDYAILPLRSASVRGARGAPAAHDPVLNGQTAESGTPLSISDADFRMSLRGASNRPGH